VERELEARRDQLRAQLPAAEQQEQLANELST
jgi:hypothetical protein